MQEVEIIGEGDGQEKVFNELQKRPGEICEQYEGLMLHKYILWLLTGKRQINSIANDGTLWLHHQHN